MYWLTIELLAPVEIGQPIEPKRDVTEYAPKNRPLFVRSFKKHLKDSPFSAALTSSTSGYRGWTLHSSNFIFYVVFSLLSCEMGHPTEINICPLHSEI